MKEKDDVLTGLWNEIYDVIQKKGISQIELLHSCMQKGYSVSQPELSKLMNHKAVLNLYQYAALCDALGLQTLHERKSGDASAVLGLKNRDLVVGPGEKAFDGYKGEYKAYFEATDKYDHRVQVAECRIASSEDDSFCEVFFELPTDILDENGQAIVKRYRGQLVIGDSIGTGYCVLEGVNVPELCFVAFRHRNFMLKQAECRLGLVLTTSEGEIKTPTAHKIYLVRSDQNSYDLNEIVPYLKFMPDNEVLISADILNGLMEDEQDPRAAVLKRAFKDSRPELFYEVSEEMLRKGKRNMNRFEIAEIFSLVLEKAELSYMARVTEWEDSRTYDLLRQGKEP